MIKKPCFSSQILREMYVTLVMDHGALLSGLIFSYPSCLIPQLRREGYEIDTLMESVLGSIAVLTTGIFTFLAILFIGHTTRKRIIQFAHLGYAIGSPFIIFAQNTSLMCIGLVIQGAVVSIFIPISLTYISEVCAKEHRGSCLQTIFVSLTAGLSLSYILTSVLSWRMIALLALLIDVSGLVLSVCIPESPFWYLLKNEKELAKSSIAWFEFSLTPEQLNERVATISQATENYSGAREGDLKKMITSLKEWKYLKPVVVGFLLNLFRGGNGRIAIGVYVESVFQSLDTHFNVEDMIRYFGFSDIIGSCVMMFIVYNMRRKTLAYFGTTVLVLCLGTVVVFKFCQSAGVFIDDFVPVIALYIYAIFVMTTYNSVVTVIVSEIQVPIYRSEMNLFHNGWVYVFCAIYSFSFPSALEVFPLQYIFLWFIANIIISMVVIAKMVPETSKMEFYENEKQPEHQFGH